MRALALALALLVALVGSAHAQFNMMVQGPSGPTYQGIGDVRAMTVYYSCTWAYTAAYATATGKLCRIVRASDSEQCDILAAASGGQGLTANCTGADNGVSLATFLTSTTGKVVTAYNQVTNGTFDTTQATDANRPAVTLSCLTTFTCLTATGGSMTLQSASNATPSNGTGTLIGYANRSTGTSIPTAIQDNLNGGMGKIVGANGVANKWNLSGNTGNFNTSGLCNDAAWHALVGAINGASSVLSCDGAETTGTATGNTTAGKIASIGGATGNLLWIESGMLDGTPADATTRAALVANMQARN